MCELTRPTKREFEARPTRLPVDRSDDLDAVEEQTVDGATLSAEVKRRRPGSAGRRVGRA